MLIRISLIIAIVAGLAAAALSFLPVKSSVDNLVAARDDYKKKMEDEQKQKQKAQADLKKTQGDLKVTQGQLAQTVTALQAAVAKATEQEKRATELSANLEKTRSERDKAQQTLNQWDIIGLTPDQVKEVQAALKKTKVERDTFVAENKILDGRIKYLENELARYVGPDKPVVLPAGLKGKVLAVDPKYDFVVLDVGGNQGVLERGEMMVNRNGRLVAKIRISSVQPTRSIANVLPEWKGEVMEGDQVIY